MRDKWRVMDVENGISVFERSNDKIVATYKVKTADVIEWVRNGEGKGYLFIVECVGAAYASAICTPEGLMVAADIFKSDTHAMMKREKVKPEDILAYHFLSYNEDRGEWGFDMTVTSKMINGKKVRRTYQ